MPLTQQVSGALEHSAYICIEDVPKLSNAFLKMVLASGGDFFLAKVLK